MKNLAKVTTLIVLLFFVGTLFISLFQLSTNVPEHGCPTMGHEESVCLMSFAEYMNSWKSTYLATTTNFANNLLALSLLIIVASVAPNLFKKIIPLRHQSKFKLRSRSALKIYIFLKDLFSNGILNPKLH